MYTKNPIDIGFGLEGVSIFFPKCIYNKDVSYLEKNQIVFTVKGIIPIGKESMSFQDFLFDKTQDDSLKHEDLNLKNRLLGRLDTLRNQGQSEASRIEKNPYHRRVWKVTIINKRPYLTCLETERTLSEYNN
ncbi:hypothetical protein SOPP22_15660 [Shewanella sp. OPT22]|nr:hypothetical protein SOPP22_15660 [Shewanella sp. OPT22]